MRVEITESMNPKPDLLSKTSYAAVPGISDKNCTTSLTISGKCQLDVYSLAATLETVRKQTNVLQHDQI